MPSVIDAPEIVEHEEHALYEEHDLYKEQLPVRVARSGFWPTVLQYMKRQRVHNCTGHRLHRTERFTRLKRLRTC